jgi:organic hydroperoxide reductase OsmC/OhrA
MHPYPHHYQAAASGNADGAVQLTSPGLPTLASAPPPEFDGPGGAWSPETLLVAALADCFILTFRAIAKASKYEWLGLECSVEGVLERGASGASFTRFTTKAKLRVPAGADVERAKVLLEKAEKGCLIANSVSGTRHLDSEITY